MKTTTKTASKTSTKHDSKAAKASKKTSETKPVDAAKLAGVAARAAVKAVVAAETKRAAEKAEQKPEAKPVDGVIQVGETRLDASKETKAGVARTAILAGSSNAEVLEKLAKAFPKDDWTKHSYYPSWYRAQLVMKGVITAEWAAEHSRAK